MVDHAPLPRPKAGPITSQLNRQPPVDRNIPDYLHGLNPEQRDAVLTTEGPVLVLAGAGTGKTRVLTTRIAHILNTRMAWGSEILAVTFTNKAAAEMKKRIHDLVPQLDGLPWMGTFHSIGVKILRRHAELVDLKPQFTILDTDDQLRLIKQLLEAEQIDEKRWPAKQFAGMLDAWKNRGWTPKDVPASEGSHYANGKGLKLYYDYQARLKSLNAADFGDLLLECIRLFRENKDVLAEYHRRFKFILVDEYQDSNTAQYLWLRLLAMGKPAPEANICVVGDDDQSIYGWRGAEVDNILRFEQDFPGAKVVKLERNYRSTANILKAASTVIAYNEGRLGKTLFTDIAEDGEKLLLTSVWDSEEEARQVGEEIEQLQRDGEQLNDIAILVRASFQMREFEERFITLGLNYRVIGGPRFYERKEIRDALAYLRLVSQPADDLAFERIINVPKRGIGDTTVKTLMETARLMNMPLLEATRQLVETEELKPKQRSTLSALVQQFDHWAERMASIPHHELAEQILDESGYTGMWQADKSPDSPGRLENLKELVRSMEGFENLGGFLEHISLVMDRDAGDASDAVSIMTLHSAKGLEFNTVFLPGWEEGLFPHQRSLDESGKAGLEEERRLAYVAITRGRKRVRLSVAQNRRIHGLWQSAIPSRFLDELPPDVVEVKDTGSSYGGYGYGGGGGASSRFNKIDPFESVYETPGWKRARENQSSRKGGGPMTIEGNLVARSVNTGSQSSSYSLNDRVFHLKFGYGTVTNIEGNKLTIDFEKAGTKKVLESFVKPG
ncbi:MULTISPECIES: UvrD-helicase domain-containing protein [unclassified Devosia]|uniref:ATP-dependent helicase n=1 Tax=unclassified Devosia TaxID=196773 RepID=UPI00145DC047|nr:MULTISPECIES: UvrD-helicase domain-containing protein [unclassified Devosia]MBJ6986604.1 UvrD-helicase domain-containing protein [Devosia sp. MC521]QMW61644.1 UvrD-helicase domain-containing protein [Devosia sp. MC521]